MKSTSGPQIYSPEETHMSARKDPPRKPASRRVALFGTMATEWRKRMKDALTAQGFTVLDNTNPQWQNAHTAEEITPLLAEDHRLMDRANLVIWHHDKDTAGDTACIELGMLVLYDRPVIVHVDEDVASREYMRALTLLHPTWLHWVETLDDALGLVPELLKA